VAEYAVIVLGGGVIGLASALECRLRGFRVILLEQGRCGGQASGAAAGMLAPFSENGEQPDAFFSFCRDSLGLYAEWLDRIGQVSRIDPEFERSGSLNVVFHEADILPMRNRLDWQQEAGVRAEWVDAAELRRMEPALTKELIGGLYYPEEAHLYAPAYVRALEEACRRTGVTIVEGVSGLTIREWERGIVLHGSPFESLHGETLILCSGAWSAVWEEPLSVRLPVYPIRGQICAYPSAYGEVRHMVFSSQGYAVGKRNGSLVCGASEDAAGFDASVTEKGINRLKRWSARLIPALQARETHHVWAGLRPATQDGFPFLGPLDGAKRVICAFGHYRNGILLSPATAKAVGDWTEGREVPRYMQAFDPMRFTSV
jgi:glycine oxidase